MSCFLFPGQGSQKPGMGLDFYEHSPAAREVFDEAALATPDAFLNIVFTAAPEVLRKTRNAQPALLIVEVAIARHLEAGGVRPDACAGHSLGEISALVVCGTCQFADALYFTQERARLMSEDVPEGSMAAVLGLAPDVIEAALPEGVQVANLNGPSQTIISGALEALDRAIEALKEAGAKRVLPLNVSGPFHSEFMRPGANALREILADVPFLPPRIPFISSVTGRQESDPDLIRTNLSEQLVQPVQWAGVMEHIGPAPALEIGPGAVLRGLAKRTSDAPKIAPVSTLEDATCVIDAPPAKD